MFIAGLLVLTSPLQVLTRIIPRILVQCERIVEKCLYVQVNSHCSGSPQDKNYPRILPYTVEIQKFMSKFYYSSLTSCQSLDCYMLVGNIGNVSYTHQDIHFDVLLLEDDSYLKQFSNDNSQLIESVSKFYTLPKLPMLNILQPVNADLPSDSSEQGNVGSVLQTFKKCVLGGTFDRLHVGHKIMLTETCLRCEDTIVVGVSDITHRTDKVLPELIELQAARMANVSHSINTIKPNIKIDIVSLVGSFGPSTVYPDLDCIIVSKETMNGGKLVNLEREKKGLSQLEVVCIDMLSEADDSGLKLSSSSARLNLLSTLLHPVVHQKLPHRPYTIGLTGGIGSGKSSVAVRLAKLGAGVIDCDKLGHSLYEAGSDCYRRVVSEFGEDIVDPEGKIDRTKLSTLVFSDKNKLDSLSGIVWPEIWKLAEEKLEEFHRDGVAVVVYDAAVLLEAGWDEHVNEVWACIIPEAEAVKRIVHRNNLSEEAALERIRSQMSGQARVQRANVVLSTLWEQDYTQKQTEKAWCALQERIQPTKAV